MASTAITDAASFHMEPFAEALSSSSLSSSSSSASSSSVASSISPASSSSSSSRKANAEKPDKGSAKKTPKKQRPVRGFNEPRFCSSIYVSAVYTLPEFPAFSFTAVPPSSSSSSSSSCSSLSAASASASASSESFGSSLSSSSSVSVSSRTVAYTSDATSSSVSASSSGSISSSTAPDSAVACVASSRRRARSIRSLEDDDEDEDNDKDEDKDGSDDDDGENCDPDPDKPKRSQGQTRRFKKRHRGPEEPSVSVSVSVADNGNVDTANLEPATTAPKTRARRGPSSNRTEGKGKKTVATATTTTTTSRAKQRGLRSLQKLGRSFVSQKDPLEEDDEQDEAIDKDDGGDVGDRGDDDNDGSGGDGGRDDAKEHKDRDEDTKRRSTSGTVAAPPKEPKNTAFVTGKSGSGSGSGSGSMSFSSVNEAMMHDPAVVEMMRLLQSEHKDSGMKPNQGRFWRIVVPMCVLEQLEFLHTIQMPSVLMAPHARTNPFVAPSSSCSSSSSLSSCSSSSSSSTSPSSSTTSHSYTSATPVCNDSGASSSMSESMGVSAVSTEARPGPRRCKIKMPRDVFLYVDSALESYFALTAIKFLFQHSLPPKSNRAALLQWLQWADVHRCHKLIVYTCTALQNKIPTSPSSCHRLFTRITTLSGMVTDSAEGRELLSKILASISKWFEETTSYSQYWNTSVRYWTGFSFDVKTLLLERWRKSFPVAVLFHFLRHGIDDPPPPPSIALTGAMTHDDAVLWHSRRQDWFDQMILRLPWGDPGSIPSSLWHDLMSHWNPDFSSTSWTRIRGALHLLVCIPVEPGRFLYNGALRLQHVVNGLKETLYPIFEFDNAISLLPSMPITKCPFADPTTIIRTTETIHEFTLGKRYTCLTRTGCVVHYWIRLLPSTPPGSPHSLEMELQLNASMSFANQDAIAGFPYFWEHVLTVVWGMRKQDTPASIATRQMQFKVLFGRLWSQTKISFRECLSYPAAQRAVERNAIYAGIDILPNNTACLY